MSARVLGRSSFAMPANSAMSLLRVWRNMNSRIGPCARSSAWTCVILCFCSGSQASFLIWANVGCITNSVRNSAMPTSTWFGGALGVPRPVRMKPRTMRIREKPVSVNSSAGTSVIPPSMSRIWMALPPSSVVVAAMVTSAPSFAADGRGRRAGRRPAWAAASARPRQRLRPRPPHRSDRARGAPPPGGGRGAQPRWRAGLVLAVGADRHDRLLGDAEEHELAAGADEVKGAVRPERDRRDGLEALAGRRGLAARFALLEAPEEAVDTGQDDREADDRADEPAAAAARGGL